MVLAQATSPPPRPLHLVGDHWTPYNPPEQQPEGATVHIIVPGDTLWDLTARYLSDPYLWPQIWEQNPYITDSHWIYPGDPVVIDVTVEQPRGTGEDTGEVPIEEETVGEPDEYGELPPAEETYIGDDLERIETVDTGIPQPLGSSADVYCFSRMVEDDGVFPYRILGTEREEAQDHYSEGDIVYIDGGTTNGVAAGDRFFIMHRVRPLLHPVSEASMGTIYSQVGQLKVLCAHEESSICEIIFACDMISDDDRLQAYRSIPVPLVVTPPKAARCDPESGKLTGYVVYIKDDVIEGSDAMLGLVDLGGADGLYPGQFAIVFRDNSNPILPRRIIGEIGFLTVHDTYSTVRFFRTLSEVHVGDRIELR